MSETAEEKIKIGYSHKDEGNEFFKKKDYKNAIRSYYKAILYIKGILSPDDECFLYSKKENRVPEDQVDSMKNLYNILFLNMTQCHLNLGNFKKALENAEKSLKLQESAKGFYRRGLAYLELKDFDQAINDFEKFKSLEPQNETIDGLIAQAKIGIKAADKELGDKLKKGFM